jgi:hypothetical protein
MVSALDKKKVEIKKAIEGMDVFEKSTRTTDTYSTKDVNGDTIKVSFKGNNLKIVIRAHGSEFPLKSKLIRDLNIEWMVKYLTWRLNAKHTPVVEDEKI